ncbi:MAG: hypothetical protein RR277_02105 [Rikenellaceae bacterium]
MKFDLTRQTFTQTLFFTSLVMFIYWGTIFVNGANLGIADDLSGVMPIGISINNFSRNFILISSIVTIALQLFNALYLSRIFIRNVVYAKNTHVAAMLFILISIGSPATNQELISQLVTTLSLFTLEGILNVKKRINSSHNFFLSSIFIALASLIYIPAAALFIPIISIFFITNRFEIREFLAALGGFLIPPIFYSYYLWITENDFLKLIHEINHAILSSFSIISIDAIAKLNIFNIISIVVIIAVMLFSLIYFLINIQTIRSKTIYSYSLFWVWMITMIAIIVFFMSTLSIIVPLCAVSASVILAFFFNMYTRRIVTNIIFVVLVILTTLANII